MTITRTPYKWVFNWVDFGIAVTSKRAEFNITQGDVAKLLGWSATAVCSVETGINEGNYKLHLLMDLANALEIDFPSFFEIERDSAPADWLIKD